MKFMGHKGRILKEIRECVSKFGRNSGRIADPFCGSGVVSWELSQQFELPVIAGDLQSFAVTRANAVISRISPIENGSALEKLKQRAVNRFQELNVSEEITGEGELRELKKLQKIRAFVENERKFAAKFFDDCKQYNGFCPTVLGAYGGYYFSARQALMIDCLRASLPSKRDIRLVGLAALIEACSKCCAAPGHTAQPFQPTNGASPYLLEAWSRDLFHYFDRAWTDISARSAKCVGYAMVKPAVETVQCLDEGDLVFIDPPYSGVHYSRFYHVLETVTRGREVAVSGKGRYPPFAERPASEFSRKTQASEAMFKLVKLCRKKKLPIVITFPKGLQSNGLSGEKLEEICLQAYPLVEVYEANSVFSSLGGGKNGNRSARKNSNEVIICASP